MLEKKSVSLEEDLRDLKIYVSDLISFLPQPFYTTSPAGILVDTDKALERLTGYKRIEIVGSDGSFLFSRKEEANRIVKETLEKGILKNYETVVLTKDKNEVIVSIQAVPRKDEFGNILGLIVTLNDMTELKRAEEERIEAEKKAARAEEAEKYSRELEKKIRDLERFQKVTMDREKRVLELKKDIKELKKQLEVK